MFLLFAALSLIAMVGAVGYLVEFARASRRDPLFGPAYGGGARRARRVTGMYTRGDERELIHQ